MRAYALPSLLGLLLGACSMPPANGAPDAGTDLAVADQGAASPDLSPGPIRTGALGAACQTADDCTLVKDAICFRDRLLNLPGQPLTPGGYCSSQCTSSQQCGAYGRCVFLGDIGATQGYCLARCYNAATCRFPDYACFRDLDICFPAGELDCDPTKGDGSCQAQVDPDPMKPKAAGGCLRETYEPYGRCAPKCQLAPGSCPVDPRRRVTQRCLYVDATTDLQLRPTADKWKGLVCVPDSEQPSADLQPCKELEACREGSQCDLLPGGDGRCHPLCIQGGTPGCGMSTTCQDALRAGAGAPGLCK